MLLSVLPLLAAANTHEPAPLEDAASTALPGDAQTNKVPPYSPPLIYEAELFDQLSPATGCWAAKPFGQNYYAATFHNVFLSRQGFLSGLAALREIRPHLPLLS